MKKIAVSATVPDWDREKKIGGEYNLSKNLLATLRSYRITSAKGGFAKLFRPLIVLRFRFWSVICGADIPLNSNIGGGLLMPHPNGIVIHPGAVIGPNCLIFQQVTIGAGSKPGFPKIGGHVDIGAGARILGGITIGDHVKVGANSVVIEDVPSNCTVVGIPGRVIKNNIAES